MKYSTLSEYLLKGYRLLPLKPGKKEPLPTLAPHGLKDATEELRTLWEWLEAAPEANWGLLAPEEVLVLDLDAREVWEGLRARFPSLEVAPRQRTPRGYHVFLRLPEGLGPITATASKRARIDFRGLGRAYVAGAPEGTRHNTLIRLGRAATTRGPPTQRRQPVSQT